MRIRFDLSALARVRWYEYAARFAAGGTMTAAAGLIAKHWGPAIGGVFLAYPAIFPASVTLIEKHEREKKRRAGIAPGSRGRKAAALDARGAMMGSVALAIFAVVAWRLLPALNGALALLITLALWLGLALLI